MDWSTARKKFFALARGRRSTEATVDDGSSAVRAQFPVEHPEGHAVPFPRRPAPGPRLFDEPLAEPRAASLCVASGKGGTGKSVVTASLAALFGAQGRTLLIDADLGVGNAHILQNASPAASLVDVIEGRRSIADAVVPCGGRVDLIAAGSGVPRMSELSSYELHLIGSGVVEVETGYERVVVDSAAGLSRQTLLFATSCDAVLVVTTPDLTAMTDAYALFKVLANRRAELRPLLLVNRAPDEAAALETAARIGRVAARFLGEMPRLVGWCPEDPEVRRCVNARTPVVVGAPDSGFSLALRRAAVALEEELSGLHPAGFGRRMVEDLAFTGPKRGRG